MKKHKAAQILPMRKKRKSKATKIIQCMPVYGNTLHFNSYLNIQIGATWPQIKNGLYDAGYTAAEVNEYRNGLLDDFRAFCKENHLIGSV